MATPAELAVIRQWCGTSIGHVEGPYDELDVQERLDRLGDAHLVALEVSRQQLADMEADPAQWQTQGDSSENWAANLDAVRQRIAALEQITGTGVAGAGLPEVGVGRITRADRGRSRGVSPCRSRLR